MVQPKLVYISNPTELGTIYSKAEQSLKEDFRYLIKQKGGLLAKGRLLGVQFDALIEAVETL